MAVQVPVGPPVVANGVEQQAVTAVSVQSLIKRTFLARVTCDALLIMFAS